MSFDPRSLGCECDTCDLGPNHGNCTPVPPEIRSDASLLIVGEAPGREEESKQAPFVGASGQELVRTLMLHGRSRYEVSLTNTILCKPPGGNMKVYQRHYGKRARKGEAVGMNPIEACKPRLDREIADAGALLLLGATAFAAARGDREGEAGLTRMRGYPILVGGADKKPAVATYHPAFVLRARRFTEVFRADVAKAFRHAENRLDWREPEILLDPTPGQLDGILARFAASSECVAIDTETDGLDPEAVNLRCVGLATATYGVVVGFQSVEKPFRVFRCGTEYARTRIANFFADSGTARLCGHNVNLYDRPVLRRHGMPLPAPERVGDSVVLSHVAESELPHDLDYLSSRYTDAPKWKPNHDHDSWTSDLELHKYCGFDCATTAKLVPKFERQVIDSGQARVYRSDIGLQACCLGMHRAGMKIDEAERRRHEIRLRKQMEDARARALTMTGGVKLNLASPDQVRDYLFDRLALPVPSVETESEEPSTNKDALYELLSRGVPPKVSEFILALIEFRQAFRSLSKDVLGLPVNQKTGRVHPTWLPHVAVTGRVSCNSPNCFDAYTEILTPSGWTRLCDFARRSEHTLVAQWDNGEISFVRPTGTVKREGGDERLLAIENTQIDLRVTPDHRCLLRHRKTGKLRVFDARDYPEDWQQIHAGTWGGGSVDLSDDLVTLLAATQADGCLAEHGIEFVFRKRRKWFRLLQAARRLSLPKSVVTKQCTKGPGVKIVLYHSPEVSLVRALLGSEKKFGPWLLSLSRRSLDRFCEEIFLWDGSAHPTPKYASASKDSAEWVQIALTLSGKRAPLRKVEFQDNRVPSYQVSTTQDGRDYSLTTNISRKEVVGYRYGVYCVSVPSSYLLVRRNGKICVTGNCANIPSTKQDPDSLRSMYVAEEGSSLVVCDLEQAELRVVAAMASDAIWLDAFASGKDVHKLNAVAFFGCREDEVTKSLRDFSKTACYLFLYGGEAAKATQLMRRVINPKTRERPYAKLTVTEVTKLRDRFLKAHSGLQRWWDRTVDQFKSVRYLRDPLLGRVRRFLDGGLDDESINEIINFRVQCVPGFVRVLTKDGYIPIDQLVGRPIEVWTGRKWASATAIAKGTAEIVQLRTDRRVKFYCDASHKLLVAGRRRYEWREAGKLKSMSRIVLDCAKEIEFGTDRDAESAYHLGLWLADGSSSKASTLRYETRFVSWAIGKKPNKDGRAGPKALQRLCAWLRSAGMNPIVSANEPTVTSVTVAVGGEQWLRSWGADPKWNAHTKRVPELIWRSSLATRKAFLVGFLDGDGYYWSKLEGSPAAKVIVHLCQRELLRELWLLFRTVGIDGLIGNEHISDKRKGHKASSLFLNAEAVRLALGWGNGGKLRSPSASYVPWWEAKRILKTGTLKPTCNSDRVLISRIRVRRPKVSPYIIARMGGDCFDHTRITSSGGHSRRVVLPVFTMIVDDPDHSYVAEGFVSHNSAIASIVSGERACGKLMQTVGWPWTSAGGLGGAGIIHNGYDAMMAEVALNKVDTAASLVEDAMRFEGEIDGVRIVIPSKAKRGKRWSECV